MKFIILLAVSYCFVSSTPIAHHKHWHLWKKEHGKRYPCLKEEIKRQSIWLANKKYIDNHNQEAYKHGYTLKMNHLGDLTTEEYQAQYLNPDILQVPDTVDWRTKNAVTEVKNQGSCGSCYAFSAVGALEGAHALAHDELVRLSEQNVIDCSVPYGNHGCNGGNMYQVFHYVIDNNGINTEESYPYKGRQGQCNFQHKSIGGTEAGIVQIPPGSESELQAATATAGPVSVAIDGSSNAFRFYEKGIFDEPNCSSSKLTHAVLIIGYGKDNGKPYWLVKNSWGTNWGMKGYIMMAKDKSNQCGIATDASFPTSVKSSYAVELAFKQDSEWLTWKQKHDKSYESDIHELEKYVTWISNRAFIEAHNQLKSDFGYRLAIKPVWRFVTLKTEQDTMGSQQMKFQEETLQEFEETTPFNRAEITHTFARFRELYMAFYRDTTDMDTPHHIQNNHGFANPLFDEPLTNEADKKGWDRVKNWMIDGVFFECNKRETVRTKSSGNDDEEGGSELSFEEITENEEGKKKSRMLD
ncbi:silicatein-like [Gigantopelta aegis]|uniref:silicatein-like n=1 Tax=Gigantopelta aegis TaxID=1735272 RepID=UPI001B88938D|nr:silicatein-like [Gigantopelta aegis]